MEGLNYEVTTKSGERKTLLSGITGMANASEMFYVMAGRLTHSMLLITAQL